MAEILKIYTPAQLKNFVRDYAVTESEGALSDWNAQSPNQILTDGYCQVTSMIAASFWKGLQLSTPVGLYVSLKFNTKPETAADGFFRFYRTPEIALNYTGTGTSCLLTITANTLTTVVTGGPGGEDLNVDLTTFTNTSDLVAALNAPPYTALLIGPGTSVPASLYDYSSAEMVAATDHRNNPGFPIMLEPASPITVPVNLILTREGITYRTIAASSILLGASSSDQIPSIAVETGTDGNMAARGIDTLDGKGAMVFTPPGVQHAINDSVFKNGEEEESADARAARFQTKVQGLNSGTLLGLAGAVGDLVGVRSATVRPFFPQAGFVTIVADDGTGALSPELIDDIRLLLDGDPNDLAAYPGIGTAGITYNVEAPNLIIVPVTFTVQRITSLSDAAEITTAIVSAVEKYVNTLPLGGDVIPSSLITAAQLAHPANYQVILTAPGSQTPIDAGSVARTGAGVGSPVLVTVVTLPEAP